MVISVKDSVLNGGEKKGSGPASLRECVLEDCLRGAWPARSGPAGSRRPRDIGWTPRVREQVEGSCGFSRRSRLQ